MRVSSSKTCPYTPHVPACAALVGFLAIGGCSEPSTMQPLDASSREDARLDVPTARDGEAVPPVDADTDAGTDAILCTLEASNASGTARLRVRASEGAWDDTRMVFTYTAPTPRDLADDMGHVIARLVRLVVTNR